MINALTSPKSRKARVYLTLGSAAVMAVGVFTALHFSHGSSKPAAHVASRKFDQVAVASVASLSPDNAPISVIGSVTSQDDAVILSEASGEIEQLRKQLGDRVSAGEVIATLENSNQEASVEQAQGAVDASQAALAKASGATAENSVVNSVQARQTLQNQQTAATASLQSAYAALYDAIYTKTSALFNYQFTDNSSLISLTVPDAQLLIDTTNGHRELKKILDKDSQLANDTNAADTDANFTSMIADGQNVETFLKNLSNVVDDAVPDVSYSAATIAGYQSSVSAALTETVNAVTGLNSAKNSYDSASAGATTAANTADNGTASDIKVAQANAEETLGALDLAKATLDKTIIRSPISGTVIDMPVTRGDFVSASAKIAEVSDPDALKVTAYVTAQDAQTLAVGNKATINGAVSGVITMIAPAIDPQTGSIEVDIGLDDASAGLTDGDSVTVDLDRTSASVPSDSARSATNVIPIVALKITPNGPAVFTVDDTKSLVAHPVEIGSILGENIEVTGGLTPDMLIVTDARGLTNGEKVSVKHP